MKRIIFALVGIGSLAGAVATTVPVSGQSGSYWHNSAEAIIIADVCSPG
jgi:hypothetical protein